MRPVPGRAVRFDARLSPGRILAVTGPSGSGKTTLLRAICGLIPWHQGRATLDGRSPEEIGWPAFRRRVGFVAQHAGMLDGTVRENLERPFSYRSCRTSFSIDEATRQLDELGIASELLDRSARDLSAGEQQRVALIRSVLIETDVLLLDEPTAALDEKATGSVESLLAELRDRHGRAILMVTHDPRQIDRLSADHHPLEVVEVS